ncbi:MAG: hypothetical protein Q8L81_10300 [Bacteroidota bacterium]|nr:hypothetical protein [Bacteroidota bacterium]
MFKSKKSIFILLPLNLFVWGYLGFKLYTTFNDSNDLPTFSESNPILNKKRNTDTLNYVLKLDYDDPFLKSGPKNQNSSTQNGSTRLNGNSVNKKKENKIAKPITPALEIKYLGIVQNKNSGATTALISINGVSQIVKTGQSINGVTFKTIDKNQIIAFAGKEKIVVVK